MTQQRRKGGVVDFRICFNRMGMDWCYDIASVVFGSAMDRVTFSVSLAFV